MKYFAFISYAHADEKRAAALSRYLETFRVPVKLGGAEKALPKRMKPIFRDREEFSASADLGASINAALAASQSLIVLCSPAAARSRWVAEEVATFRRLRDPNRVFSVLLEGEPNDAFPVVLLKGAVEPLAVDFRSRGNELGDEHIRLVAALLNIDFDALKGRERRRLRAARLRIASLIAASTCAIAFASLQITSVRAIQYAKHLADVALQLGTDNPTGSLLAVEAQQEAATAHNAGVLLQFIEAKHTLTTAGVTQRANARLGNLSAKLGTSLIASTVRNLSGVPALIVLDAKSLSSYSTTAGFASDSICGYFRSGRLASAYDGRINLYDVPRGLPVRRLSSLRTGKASSLSCLQPSSVLFIDGSGAVARADLSSSVLRRIRNQTNATGIALSPTTDLAAILHEKSIDVIDTRSEELLRTFPRGASTDSRSDCTAYNCADVVAFTPDETRIGWVEGSENTTIVRTAAVLGVSKTTRDRISVRESSSRFLFFHGRRARPDVIFEGVRTRSRTQDNLRFAYSFDTSNYVEAKLAPSQVTPLLYDDRLGTLFARDADAFASSYFARWSPGIDAPLIGLWRVEDQAELFFFGTDYIAVAGPTGPREYSLVNQDFTKPIIPSQANEEYFDSGDGAHLATIIKASGLVRVLEFDRNSDRTDVKVLFSRLFAPADYPDASVAYDPDNRVLSIVSAAGLRLFSLEGNEIPVAPQFSKTLASLKRDPDWPWKRGHFSISHRGRYVILSHANVSKTPREMQSPDFDLDSPDQFIVGVDGSKVYAGPEIFKADAFSPDDRFATARDDGIYRLPSMKSLDGDFNRESKSNLEPIAAVSRNEKIAASWTSDDRLQLLDLRDHEKLGPPLPSLPFFKNNLEKKWITKASSVEMHSSFSASDRVMFSRDDRLLLVFHRAEAIGYPEEDWLAVYAIDPSEWQRELCIADASRVSMDALRSVASGSVMRPCQRFSNEIIELDRAATAR